MAKDLKPQSNVVIPEAPEGEESTEQQALNLAEKAVGIAEKAQNELDSKRRRTEEEKAEILAWAEAQGRGGLKRASEKFGISYVTLNSWKAKAGKGETTEDGSPAKAPRQPRSESPVKNKVDMNRVYTVLGGKGFKFQLISTYGPKGLETEFKADPKLAVLNMKEHHGAIWDVESGVTSVVSTERKLVVAMPLETLLELMKIKP